ncbi:four helix bundle protein [Gaoshiqia sp. Z1-71]|uniref:four helix bundle protein n=1 Tax=Gaoshiqia hydrogeniformans TaxID=3290090 RepID=UPI003BF8EFCF
MNENNKKYIPLKELEVYQLARELSKQAWQIYEKMSWQRQKIIGDQFITSIDSIGANIAEGYGRFHYLDKIKFYYNSRASMLESIIHWLELLLEREMISSDAFDEMKKAAEKLSIKLNNFISTTYNAKRNYS